MVDDNLQFLESLSDYFSQKSDIEICGLAEDGLSAITFLTNTTVDLIILDIIMPNLDGMAVLDWLLKREIDPVPDVIVTTALRQEDVIRMTNEKGVKYFMTKPISTEHLYNRILEIRRYRETRSLQNEIKAETATMDEEIAHIFLAIGIPAHIKGYQFLREGVKMVADNREIIDMITQQLYPQVANQFHTTASKVESAMRHAIDISWTRGKLANINRIFGCEIYTKNEKPTNGEFIALIAEKLHPRSTL